MSTNDVRSAVESWLAENRMRELRDYVSRGRSFEHTPAEELAGEWVSLMQAWAAEPGLAKDKRRADIDAEHELRGLKPPYELVKREIDIITRTAADAAEHMSDEAKEQLNDDVLSFSAMEKAKAN